MIEMIYLKTDEEIELMFHANQLVGMTLGELAKHVTPGVSTLDLDKIAEEFIRDHGAVPAFLGYGGFPNSICASINEQVVHGIPSSKAILKEGDIISIDCGTILNGFVGDSAYTFAVGEIAPEVQRLLDTTKESLYIGIQAAVEGRRIGDIRLFKCIMNHVAFQSFENWLVMELVSACMRNLKSLIMDAEDVVLY